LKTEKLPSLDDEDGIGLRVFGKHGGEVLLEIAPHQKDRVLTAIKEVKTGGDEDIFAALRESVKNIQQIAVAEKRIILLTDLSPSKKEIRRISNNIEVEVYSVRATITKIEEHYEIIPPALLENRPIRMIYILLVLFGTAIAGMYFYLIALEKCECNPEILQEEIAKNQADIKVLDERTHQIISELCKNKFIQGDACDKVKH
jgi:hypothetical protein